MPRALLCVNGHRTEVPGDDPSGVPASCPECGGVLSGEPPATLPLSETTEAGPGSKPRRPSQRPAARQPRRRWGRTVAIAVGVAALAAASVGVYFLVGWQGQRADTSPDPEAARDVVVRFVESSKRGEKFAIDGLLTDLAREQIRKGNGRFESDLVNDRPGVTYTVGEAALDGDRGKVPVVVREAGTEQTLVFLVRRQGADWRVHGFSAPLPPGSPFPSMTIDLENPQNLVKDFFGADPEEIGKEWSKEWEQNLREATGAASRKPGPDDRANEALAALDRGAFEATWKADLDAKERPAGEILRELAAAMGVELLERAAPARSLSRPVTVQLSGRSRWELAEEVARRVGLYTVLEDRFAPGTKSNAALSLRPGPRPYPVAFAGPFVVELAGVDEYAPHATGQLTFRVTALGLPRAVSDMLGSERDPNVLSVAAVTDSAGRGLSDSPEGPKFRSGLVRAGGYDRTSELQLKNLLRDVTAVKAVRGAARVPLPVRVDTLRLEPAVAGAEARAGAVVAKLDSVRQAPKGFGGEQSPGVNFRLEYKGVPFGRVRVLGYDAAGGLLVVSPSGTSQGTEAGGNGEFAARGSPAAVVVKAITGVEYAEYPFSLGDITLPGAAGQPQKLTPAAFPGHDAPVGVEFVRIISPRLPEKAQFRLVNHSDKAVRAVEVRLAYLDAAGKELGTWRGETIAAPQGADGRQPPVVVGPGAAAAVEAAAPFLPEGARTIRVDIKKAVFADASEWVPPPAKK